MTNPLGGCIGADKHDGVRPAEPTRMPITKVYPNCVYDPIGGVQKNKRHRFDASGNVVYLHSFTNHMDHFTVDKCVVARHNQYGSVPPTELVDEIRKERCVLVSLRAAPSF